MGLEDLFELLMESFEFCIFGNTRAILTICESAAAPSVQLLKP
jgi:hypothetical protein